MINAKYIKSDGRIYEVVGFDGRYPVTRLTDLKEIPVDKPLRKPEPEVKAEEKVEEVVEEKPVRRRTRKK